MLNIALSAVPCSVEIIAFKYSETWIAELTRNLFAKFGEHREADIL